MKPNVLFIMTDQQRWDTIAALGNGLIYTPNMDRLVRRGAAFTRAYSPCPVCVPARYCIRTGCEPKTTGVYHNGIDPLLPGEAPTINGRCGPYIADTMKRLGYRTWGIGKFHTAPWNEPLGFDVHLHSEEMWGGNRLEDAYCRYLDKVGLSWIDQPHGERTEMYYQPQMSPMQPEHTVEGWAAREAVRQIEQSTSGPWFGFVSFIGPHPPFAPPQPFNRLYDPDKMPSPIYGDLRLDHMDEQIPWMNRLIWADNINDSHAQVLKARYYGEITYIDWCLGHILDAVEARPDADNTIICFFADHGDHMGDHHAWQKESFYEGSAHIPFLVSWPSRIRAGQRRAEFVSLTDLFGIATSAAGAPDLRDGCDLLGVLDGKAQPREHLFSTYGTPGTAQFKVMVRWEDWKYIYLANGGREQLFNLRDDPHELRQRLRDRPDIASALKRAAEQWLDTPNVSRALDKGRLKRFRYVRRPDLRIRQMAGDRGAVDFPKHPSEVVDTFAANHRL